MGRAKAGICEWVLPERGPEALRHAAALGFDEAAPRDLAAMRSV